MSDPYHPPDDSNRYPWYEHPDILELAQHDVLVRTCVEYARRGDPAFALLALIVNQSRTLARMMKMAERVMSAPPIILIAERCTRPTHTEGPCNEVPREECPGYAEWLDSFESRRTKNHA
jgi:hypothetical protein